MDGQEPTTAFEPLNRTDIVLAVLTFPLLLFVVMFAVSGTTDMLNSRRQRLRFGIVLLAIELVVVGIIVAAVT